MGFLLLTPRAEGQSPVSTTTTAKITTTTIPPTTTTTFPFFVDYPRWERLHNCEQPGQWYADGYNSADAAHQRFQGGLGMSTGAWQIARSYAANRGVSLPFSALSASPKQQMIGAQALFNDLGWAWGCRV